MTHFRKSGCGQPRPRWSIKRVKILYESWPTLCPDCVKVSRDYLQQSSSYSKFREKRQVLQVRRYFWSTLYYEDWTCINDLIYLFVFNNNITISWLNNENSVIAGFR